MIKSYRDKEAKTIASGTYSKKLPNNIQRRAKMRLDRMNAAIALDDLVLPPSHMLEALKGKRKGQHSIRINQQYRVCFVWKDGNAYEVEIVDYH